MKRIFLFIAAGVLFQTAPPSFGQQITPTELPLAGIDALEYAGAFRLPAETFGISSLNYSEGPLAYNANGNSLFIVGHNHQQAIAEFAIPDLIKTTVLTDLSMADAPLQAFASLLDRVPGGNPQEINTIGGLACFDTASGTQMLVNGYEYYDAPADNTHSTFVVRNANDLDGSSVQGFFEFEGGAGHTSGWMSPIPDIWQSELGGSYLTGQSSGIPIIGRTSVGPSAFAFEPSQVLDNSQPSESLSSVKLLDFSLDFPLHSDLSNDTKNNDVWTHLSRAVYGFILPGTRTYLTLGYSGGHNSGVCYKCTQNNGNVCGGYCAPDAADYYQYYWLWDVNDLLAVRNGQLASHAVRPYDYGPFPTPFEGDAHAIGGGTFDPASGMLYLTIQRADNQQGEYSNPPVIVAFEIDDIVHSVSNEQSDTPGISMILEPPFPNPFRGQTAFKLQIDALQEIDISLYDILGRKLQVIHNGSLTPHDVHTFTIDAGNRPAGLYFLQVSGRGWQKTVNVALTY